ncbi:MAG: DUF4149 domain-containing protein [Mariprofundaceae bacterium]
MNENMKFNLSTIADCDCLSVACLRAGAVRLSLALVLALLIVPAYVVAPVLFSLLDSHAQAGHLAGAVFHIGNRSILVLLLAIAAFWWQRQAGRLRWILLLGLACVVGINEFSLSPLMEGLKSSMGSIDALPMNDPQRAEFGMWHGISAVLHLFAALMAALLVALGWAGQRKEHCKP